MADISSVNAGGTEYGFKDTEARKIASTTQVGRVKPDGTTITVDNDGTIHGTSRDLITDTVGWTGKNLFVPQNVRLISGEAVGNTTFSSQTNTAVVAKLKHNTDYVASHAASGYSNPRFRLALSESYPVLGGGCYTVVSDASLTNYQFNSGNYNYALLHCAASIESLDAVQAMLCTLDEWNVSHDYEPYHDSVKETLRDAEVIDSANLLPFHTQIKTFQFFADENGYISCSAGSDTRGWSYASANEYITLPAGTYKYKAFQKTGSTSGYTGFKIYKSNGTRILDGTIPGALEGGTFTLSEASDLGVECKVGNGSYAFQIINENEDNNVYHIWYEPLKDRKLDITDEQVLGAWNLAENQASSTTDHGVSYVVNADKSVTASNTASANSYLTVFTSKEKFKARTYYLSGCPSGGDLNSTYCILLRTSPDGTTWTLKTADEGAGVAYNLKDDAYIRLEIFVKSGVNVDGKTFYPMLALQPGMPYVPWVMTNKEITNYLTAEKLEFSAIQKANDGVIYQNTVLKYGNLVHAYLHVSKVTVSAYTNICILPSSCKPKNPMNVWAINSSDSTPLLIQIKADGGILSFSALSDKSVVIHLVYSIEN